MKNLIEYIWECCLINTGYKRALTFPPEPSKFMQSLKQMHNRYDSVTAYNPWTLRQRYLDFLYGQVKPAIRDIYQQHNEDNYGEALFRVENWIAINSDYLVYTNPLHILLSIYQEVLQEEQTGVNVEDKNSVIQGFF